MKRRISVAVAIIMLLAASLSAAPLFQIGGLVSYNKSIADIKEDEGVVLSFGNFSLGADARLTLFKHLNLDIPATIGFGEGNFTIATIPTVNFNLPITPFFDLAVGAGTQLDFVRSDSTWSVNGREFDSFGEAIASSKLVYRAALTVNVTMVSIGLSAVFPGSETFNGGDVLGIFTPSWENSRISASVLFNFL